MCNITSLTVTVQVLSFDLPIHATSPYRQCRRHSDDQSESGILFQNTMVVVGGGTQEETPQII